MLLFTCFICLHSHGTSLVCTSVLYLPVQIIFNPARLAPEESQVWLLKASQQLSPSSQYHRIQAV